VSLRRRRKGTERKEGRGLLRPQRKKKKKKTLERLQGGNPPKPPSRKGEGRHSLPEINLQEGGKEEGGGLPSGCRCEGEVEKGPPTKEEKILKNNKLGRRRGKLPRRCAQRKKKRQIFTSGGGEKEEKGLPSPSKKGGKKTRLESYIRGEKGGGSRPLPPRKRMSPSPIRGKKTGSPSAPPKKGGTDNEQVLTEEEKKKRKKGSFLFLKRGEKGKGSRRR